MRLTEEDIIELQAGIIGPELPDISEAELDGWESAIDAVCTWLLAEHERQEVLTKP